MIGLRTTYFPDNFEEIDDLRKTRLYELKGNIALLSRQLDLIKEVFERNGYRYQADNIHGPESFTSVEFISADEKRKILKRWTVFVKAGFQWHLFTEAIYNHISLHCGYIAHYDRHCFYTTYWAAEELHQYAKDCNLDIRPVPTSFYGWESFLKQFDIWGNYADISYHMMKVLEAELIATKEELHNETKELYSYEIKSSLQLYLGEKEKIKSNIEDLRDQIARLTDRLGQLTENGFIEEIKNKYETDFPGIDVESVTPEYSEMFLF